MTRQQWKTQRRDWRHRQDWRRNRLRREGTRRRKQRIQRAVERIEP